MCLSRFDNNKAIFNQPIYERKKQKRTNFFNLIKVEKDTLICGNRNYSISSICQFPTHPEFILKQPCQLSTKEEIDIHPIISSRPELCFDYSFWKNPNRCSEMKNATYVISCNRTKCFDCVSIKGEHCPKSSTSKGCSKITHFYCKTSETCIPKGRFISIF